MPKKGENIRKRKDGRWEARYVAGRQPDGGARMASVYGRTYREAKAKKEAALRAARKEPPAAQDRGQTAYSQVLDGFLNSHRYQVKESTYTHYVDVIESHIRPSLGRVQDGPAGPGADREVHGPEAGAGQKGREGRPLPQDRKGHALHRPPEPPVRRRPAVPAGRGAPPFLPPAAQEGGCHPDQGRAGEAGGGHQERGGGQPVRGLSVPVHRAAPGGDLRAEVGGCGPYEPDAGRAQDPAAGDGHQPPGGREDQAAAGRAQNRGQPAPGAPYLLPGRGALGLPPEGGRGGELFSDRGGTLFRPPYVLRTVPGAPEAVRDRALRVPYPAPHLCHPVHGAGVRPQGPVGNPGARQCQNHPGAVRAPVHGGQAGADGAPPIRGHKKG